MLAGGHINPRSAVHEPGRTRIADPKKGVAEAVTAERRVAFGEGKAGIQIGGRDRVVGGVFAAGRWNPGVGIPSREC